MPKSKPNKGDAIIPFHALVHVDTVTNLATVALDASSAISDRVNEALDIFQYYRYEKLSFRIHPVGAESAVCFLGSVANTAPMSRSEIMENLDTAYLAAFMNIPTKWTNVPSSRLRGQFPWFKTRQGTSDVTEAVQGAFYFWTASSSGTCIIEFRGEVRGNSPIDPSDTVAIRELRQKVRELRDAEAKQKERDKILSLLAPVSSTATGGVSSVVTSPGVGRPGSK